MYTDVNPGGKSYLYHRTLKRGCPKLVKLANKETNRMITQGVIRGSSFNTDGSG